MRPNARSAADVEALANELLGTTVVQAEHIPLGFGNENWRVTATDGASYVLKIGPIESGAKWSSTRVAHELATVVGVPLPELVHVVHDGDHVVRLYRWIDGRPPSHIASEEASVSTLFADLGTAIAALHSVDLDTFSSRLDGSAPAFHRWSDYVAYRVQQIRGRCSEHDAVDLRTLDQTCVLIGDLASEVNDAVRPTLCHRDLYEDNLLVDEHGRLLAILDWDMAEASEPAGDSFKLEWLLFPAFPGSEAAFDAAYRAVHPEPPSWARRKRLVDLMETLNAIANAAGQSWNAEFEARARSRLHALLASK